MARKTPKNRMRPDLAELNRKVGSIQGRLRDIPRDIQRLTRTDSGQQRAVVNRLRCTGCGLCEQVCPAHAIRVTYLAHVDPARCTGCGTCVQNCPQGALALRRKQT